MQRINWNNPPEDPGGLSFADLKRMYGIVWRAWQEAKRKNKERLATLSASRKDELALRQEKKVLTSKVKLISKKAAAAQSFKETSGWSAGAISCVTILWAAFSEYGYPGPAWLFEHEIVYGGACWVATTFFAWAAKAYYGAD
ncbi:MAG TPA: hypothetical protein DDW23_05505 [Planctomycetes bacterium]|nr:hypothetical protein [Planctomycetota bacterium]